MACISGSRCAGCCCKNTDVALSHQIRLSILPGATSLHCLKVCHRGSQNSRGCTCHPLHALPVATTTGKLWLIELILQDSECRLVR